VRRASLLLARVVALTLGLLSSWFGPCTTAHAADPGYYVVTAYDNAGQRAIDFRYWTVQAQGDREWIWPELGFSYGVNSRWTTELFTSYIGTSNWDVVPSTLNWQNDVLLTQGEWPFDLALHLNLYAERDRAEGNAWEFGPAFQTELGPRTQLNANIFFERYFRTEEPGPTELKYQWQIKRRVPPHWAFGLQGFGELGPWDHWSARAAQSHRAGPAVFATLPLRDGRSVQLQAAYLIGEIYAKHGRMFSLRAACTF